jgi:hypothetical protein
MKNWILIMMLFAGFSAQGQVEIARGPLRPELRHAIETMNESQFSTLAAWFDQGTQPDLERVLNGAWVGRCFSVKEPDTGRPAIAAFRKVGSQIPGMSRLEGANDFEPVERSDLYDGEARESLLQKLHSSAWSEILEGRKELQLDFHGLVQIKTRTYREFLVQQVSSLPGHPSSNPSVIHYCYYFIRK